ncbi:MAG: hypothetical protein R2705_13510 [Ilumatobacteraceae bacterium]
MTDTFQLPERFDATNVDVTDLVARLEARTVVLDWAQVTEADPATLRTLMSPFLDRIEQFEDALGIMTMPEVIEPVVNHVVTGTPLPEPGPSAWLVLQRHDSKYADEEGQHYEYPPRIPNGRRVSVGDTIVCCLSKKDAVDDGRIFGIGTVGEIVEVDDDRVRAVYADYVTIEPLLSFEQVGGDPRPNANNAINRIPMAFADRVRTAHADRTSRPSGEVVLPEMDLTTGEGVRNALHDLVALDLLGPACGPNEELLEDAPRTRYVVGTLAPRDAPPEQLALDDRLAGAGETGIDEGGTDAPVPASNTLFSSSIGFTFVVAAGVDAVTVDARWGAYERVPSELHFTERDEPRMVWRRRPHGKPFDLPLQTGRVEVVPDGSSEGVVVDGIIRPPGDDGSRIVTLFLINAQHEPSALKDSAWVFQPELRVMAIDGQSAIFVRRDQAADLDPDSGDPEAEERHSRDDAPQAGRVRDWSRRRRARHPGRESVGRRRRLGAPPRSARRCCRGTTSRSPRPPTTPNSPTGSRLRRLRVGHGRTRRTRRHRTRRRATADPRHLHPLDRRTTRPDRHRPRTRPAPGGSGAGARQGRTRP